MERFTFLTKLEVWSFAFQTSALQLHGVFTLRLAVFVYYIFNILTLNFKTKQF